MISASDLRSARQDKGWTQARAAVRLGVSQAYVSLLETGGRHVSVSLLARVHREYDLSPAMWPFLDTDTCSAGQLAAALGALGFPGFAHLPNRRRLNPAQALLHALKQDRLESRSAAALPWVIAQYPRLDWDWLIDRVKLADCQNRLGFLVSLARRMAERSHDAEVVDALSRVEERLERSVLAREDSLGQPDMTDAERRWLRRHRSAAARRWHLLSNLSVEHLTNAT